MDIHEKLKDIIVKVASKDISILNITDQTVLTNDLGFDSVQIIILIVELESQFEIEIEDDDMDLEKITVYKNLYEIIYKKINIQNEE